VVANDFRSCSGWSRHIHVRCAVVVRTRGKTVKIVNIRQSFFLLAPNNPLQVQTKPYIVYCYTIFVAKRSAENEQ